MNAQKFFSSITILASMAAGAITSFASPSVVASPVQVLPTVSQVLPDPLPLDTSEAPARIQTTAEITIFGASPKAFQPPPKRWTCGAFRPLATDASAQVRECGWK
jgi:hypothetical protein